MDWNTLQAGMATASDRPRDGDMPDRAFRLNALSRLLDGTMYDHLGADFEEDYRASGEYVPTRLRRPSIRHDWCRIAVEDSVALLFSEGRFPTIACDDEPTRDTIAALVKETALNATMVECATRGSIGTAEILLRAMGEAAPGLRVFFDCLDPRTLTPTYTPTEPDVLLSVREGYKIKRADLLAAGYAEGDLLPTTETTFWFGREWTEQAEMWFAPQPMSDKREGKPPRVDAGRSVPHALGFVPLVWVRNLPGGPGVDGRPTLTPGAISTMIEADYQVSQAGRGQRYNGEPTLLVKDDGSLQNRSHTGGSTNAITVPFEGDAKLLEISGNATKAVLDFVQHLRATVLEGMRGNRTDADKLSAASSGRAMELMNQSLIWLADQLRVSYGEGALLSLMRMVCKANEGRKLLIGGQTIAAGALKPDGLALRWRPWYSPTYTDAQAQASTLNALHNGGLMSRETAVTQIAAPYDIEDVAAELAAIANDQATDDARMIALAAQTKASATVES